MFMACLVYPAILEMKGARRPPCFARDTGLFGEPGNVYARVQSVKLCWDIFHFHYFMFVMWKRGKLCLGAFLFLQRALEYLIMVYTGV